MNGLTAEERAMKWQVKAAERRVRKEAKAARPKKVAPPRTDKPDSALRERRPRVRDNGHLQFIRRLPCVMTFHLTGEFVGGCDAAHVRSGFPEAGWSYTGKAEKPDDWRTVPLTRAMHTHQHARGDERAWWAEHGLYPPAVVAVLVQARTDGRDGPEVIREAVAAGRLPRDPDTVSPAETAHPLILENDNGR